MNRARFARRAQPAIAMAMMLTFVVSCSGEPVANELTTIDATSSTSTSAAPATSTSSAESSTTLPEDPGLLLVVGDWGSGTAPEGAVAGSMWRFSESAEIDAILTTGDNFYTDNVSFTLEPYQWAIDADIPFWVTWGNHDVESDLRVDLVNDAFGSPPRWTTHSWGAMEIVILDSNQPDDPVQLAFIEDTLSEATTPTMVVFHHPPYSCGRYGDNGGIVDRWVPLFDDDVVLVLSGHEHNYQRFLVGDLTYVVTGGGGRGLYEIDDCPSDHPPLQGGHVEHHFVVLEQTAGTLTVTAIDILGEVLDTFEIQLD